MEKSLHVFVCSTYRDLVNERKALGDGLEWLRTQFPALTYSCPRSIHQLDAAKVEIAESDVLVLILGHLQGVIAPGLDISHGEAEYETGMAQGKKVLVYFRDESVGLHPVHFERDPHRAALLKAFKEKLAKRHGAKVFTDLQSLVHLVNLDLTEIAHATGLDAKPGSKTTRLKAKTWDTRKMPLTGSMAPPPDPGSPDDGVTRTIPILQKALTIPFRTRKRPSSRMGAVLVAAMALVIGAGFVLAKFHKPAVTTPSALPAGPRAADLTATPGTLVPYPADAALRPVPEAVEPPAPSTVVLEDDQDSVKTILRLAQNGTPEDKFQVGRMYEEGRDVPRDDSASFRWYRKAAEAGHTDAQYKLGLMYRYGKGCVKSTFLAAKWFEAAAEQGHPKSQVKLGHMYRSGKGVPRNETTAFKWFLKAADQKEPEAEKILAELREN